MNGMLSSFVLVLLLAQWFLLKIQMQLFVLPIMACLCGLQRIFILYFVHNDASAAQPSPSIHVSSNLSTALYLTGHEGLGVLMISTLHILMHVG